MIQLAAMAVAWAAMQDPVSEAIDRGQKEFQMSLVELGPAAIPELEKRAEGPHRETIKKAIDEIRKLREPIEKLMAQLSELEVPARDFATLELLKIGRPARAYLEGVPMGRADRARAEWILRRSPFKNRKPPVLGIQQELELMRLKERVEIQKLRVRAMEPEVAKGRTTNLELTRARRELEKAKHRAGEITLSAYLASARDRTAEELELVERDLAAGKVMALDVLKVRIQVLYLDRRLGKEVGEEIKKLVQEASQLLRQQASRGWGGEYAVLEQLFQLATDRNEDLD